MRHRHTPMMMTSDPFSPPPHVEVATSVQSRPCWTTAEKVCPLQEAMQPGMSVSYVARRAGPASSGVAPSPSAVASPPIS